MINQFLTFALQARGHNTLHMMMQHVIEGITVTAKYPAYDQLLLKLKCTSRVVSCTLPDMIYQFLRPQYTAKRRVNRKAYSKKSFNTS